MNGLKAKRWPIREVKILLKNKELIGLLGAHEAQNGIAVPKVGMKGQSLTQHQREKSQILGHQAG